MPYGPDLSHFTKAREVWLKKLTFPCAVVCHDAGGANIILSAVDGAPAGFQIYVDGPAANLARQRLPSASLLPTLEDALAGATDLLTGTGWASDLEHVARWSARQRGLRSTAVLDHWVNYPERFSRRGEMILPDRLWVTDTDARDLADLHFPSCKAEILANCYLIEQLARIGPAPPGDTLLYVLEPTRTDWGRQTAGEFQALDFFFANLPALGLPPNLTIRLRLHPSEPRGKYDAWLKDGPKRAIMIDDSADLAEAIGRASWVAGCESYGLVMALAAHRTVYCTLPPHAPQCRLPHAGLVHLRQVV